MLGKLRNKLKNKKGFTMVELIIVIVIILILGAALVPQLTKYIDRANQANCKNDAATTLAQLQVDYVDHLSEGNKDEFKKITFGGVDVEKTNTEIKSEDTMDGKGAQFYIDEKSKEIVGFKYCDGKYYTVWAEGVWTDPAKVSSSSGSGNGSGS